MREENQVLALLHNEEHVFEMLYWTTDMVMYRLSVKGNPEVPIKEFLSRRDFDLEDEGAKEIRLQLEYNDIMEDESVTIPVSLMQDWKAFLKLALRDLESVPKPVSKETTKLMLSQMRAIILNHKGE